MVVKSTRCRSSAVSALGVIALVNASLWIIKRRGADDRTEGPTDPIWMCITDCVLCLAFLGFRAVWFFWLNP